MKTTKIIVIALLVQFSSFTYAQELEKQMVGTWAMLRVFDGDKDVSAEHNPKGNRYFIINADGSFESGGDPYGKNTGKVYINDAAGIFYLDSDAGPDDDSTWKLSFEGNTMIWQGFGNEWADRFKLVHVKKEKESR